MYFKSTLLVNSLSLSRPLTSRSENCSLSSSKETIKSEKSFFVIRALLIPFISFIRLSEAFTSSNISFGFTLAISSKRLIRIFLNDVVLNSPVLISDVDIPIFSTSSYIVTRYVLSFSKLELESTKVPGVIIFTTPLFTIPLACFGSSSCSHMATLYPLFTSLGIYAAAA